jgi:hypothetical protein
MQVNSKVRLLKDVYEDADDHSPGGYLARKGETLVIRHITPGGHWLYRVSHENITDNSFGVTADEIELIEEPT